MREIVIASAVRTPVGKFLGSFANTSAVELGAIAVLYNQHFFQTLQGRFLLMLVYL